MSHKPKRVALLGGAGGIGRALTARAMADGWQVSVLDLAVSLDRHPPPDGVASLAVDLAEPETVERGFAEIGAMDGFVNLAGFTTSLRSIEDTTLAEFDEAMTGNFRGAYLAAKAALPGLRAAGGGAMVNIVSGLAAYIRPGYGLYGASKAAMVHLTKTLAVELAPDIRVNAVGPAAVDTAFLRGGTGRSDETAAPNLDIEAYTKFTPLRRIAQTEDITGPIMFLLGADSAFMTGQTLWVNGGGYMP